VKDIFQEESQNLKPMLSALERIQSEIVKYNPKALLLFGSLARYLSGDTGERQPNDVDLLVITNNTPFIIMNADFGCAVEFHCFSIDRAVKIARILRYDSRASALSKLYGSVLARKHSISIIAAAMMLGPDYGNFGIEQIEVNGITDTRDYSVHRALVGEPWWSRLCRYARERRGPLKRFSDKISYNYDFKG
jgi:predicted nucleotidyltransferase